MILSLDSLNLIMFCFSGNHDEGELPQDSVFPDPSHLDSFVQQMCDAIHDEPMDVETNRDAEQVDNVELMVICSGISNSGNILFEQYLKELGNSGFTPPLILLF